MCGSISFTDDRPKDYIQAKLHEDVSLGWTFSYSDSENIPSGPWNAPDVQEISFGIWKSINGKIFFTKKIVAVNSHGKFTWRSGYDNKIDWSHSKHKLTFTLKDMTTQEQGTYGLNVELGLNQKPLEHYVSVKIGVSYVGQDENTAVRNETGYLSETVDLLYKRSPKDKEKSFSKYRIYKGNVTVITLGKEEDGKGFTCAKDKLLATCKERYSLRYVNETDVSFQLRNLTQDDAGRYLCQTYFLGVNDPEYEEINLNVQEKPTTQTPERTSRSPKGHDTSPPRPKSGYSDIQPSIILLVTFVINKALF